MNQFKRWPDLKMDQFQLEPILKTNRFQKWTDCKIEFSVSFYPSSGSIKDYRFHICHNQFKNDVFSKSRSICRHFHSCQLSNVNLIDTASNFGLNELNLPQSLNFSFRSSNSCWAYSYNSISSEFIARILKQLYVMKFSR